MSDGKVCGDCEHAYVGPDGLFCMIYREMVMDEGVAEQCPSFGSIPANIMTEWVARPAPVPEAIRRVLVASPDDIREVLRQAPPEVLCEEPLDYVVPISPADLDDVVAMSPSPELVTACENYLSLRHCVLWGKCFEILSTSGRNEAAEWLAAQITALNYVAS